MSSTPSAFEKKVKELQESIDTYSSKKESCVPTLFIVGIVALLLIWLALYFLKPSFVQKKDGKKVVRDNKKVFMWTVILTLGVWLALYAYSYFSNHKTSMFCSKK